MFRKVGDFFGNLPFSLGNFLGNLTHVKIIIIVQLENVLVQSDVLVVVRQHLNVDCCPLNSFGTV